VLGAVSCTATSLLFSIQSVAASSTPLTQFRTEQGLLPRLTNSSRIDQQQRRAAAGPACKATEALCCLQVQQEMPFLKKQLVYPHGNNKSHWQVQLEQVKVAELATGGATRRTK
jgi:hypothetical protein